LSVIVWIGFAVLTAAGAYRGLPENPAVRWIMAGLAFGCGGVLLILTWALARRIRIAYFLATGLLVLVAVFTLADNFGPADLLYLALVLIPLVLMIKDRSWYLHKESSLTRDG
jgi:chromate transport protein ChrA